MAPTQSGGRLGTVLFWPSLALVLAVVGFSTCDQRPDARETAYRRLHVPAHVRPPEAEGDEAYCRGVAVVRELVERAVGAWGGAGHLNLKSKSATATSPPT